MSRQPSTVSFTPPLPRRFYQRPVDRVARDLLGRALFHRTPEGLAGGIIVETEAYDQSDPASHCFNGPTERNRAMFGPAGHAYVYRSYGIHWCVNLVTGAEGHGAAVLLRALQPLVGLELMARRRGLGIPERRLALGPGCLCQALGITLDQYGADLTGHTLWVASPPGRFRRPPVRATPRVGISRATHVPWRFVIPDHPFVSGPRRLR